MAQRDPIQTAKLVASIDQVSGGRFLFGIGNGWNRDELEDHGIDFAQRHKVARERVEAMKAIWTQSKAEYHGEFVNFDPMMTWPKPVQKPHPPVIVGGAFPYSARRAIRYGDGWIPQASRGAYAEIADMIPEFRKMATEAGRDPKSIDITVWFPKTGRRPDEALPGPRRVARGVQPGVREGRRAAAGDRWLGRPDATGQRLSQRIPYGLDRLPRTIALDDPRLRCATVGDEPLRLNSEPVPQDAMPLVIGDHAARVAAAIDWLTGLCGDYAPLRRQFIAAYFSVIATQLEAHRADLVERLNPYDGLYAPEDFLWSALMPLPRGWVPVGDQIVTR